ncbi:hypothetical protein EI94DRAFT_1597967 [Lactarius quietus]|nr:hypothetical protein EI94DRAFT_1633132 [Lactarius quietus]KAF8263337.1 hypothetical protein EI94DRAFT_1597967 [Lactarius quietus]
MGWFGDDHDATQAYGNYQDANQASVTHELLGGAAAYEAAKAYENHCAANGQPTSHAKAKELLAGFAGAYVDREVETKGFDYIDREKAKRAGEYPSHL